MYRRSESFRESGVFWPAPDRDNLIPALMRELKSEMTQPVDALDCNQVARECAAVPQRIVCGDSRA